MNMQWNSVRLGEVIKQRKEFVSIDDLKVYKRPRVQLHVKGIVLRDEIAGALIKTKQQQICHAGEFLVAEIDAKVGGFGIVPDNLDGAIVSSHYFLFVADRAMLNPAYLDYFTRTPAFCDQVAAQGSTNYAAIRPTDVLGYEIPLPPLAEQQHIAVRIEELSTHIHEALALRQQAVEETEALVQSHINQLLEQMVKSESCNLAFLPELVEPIRHAIKRGPFGSHLRKEFFVPSGYKVYEQKHAIYGDFTNGSYYIDEGKFGELKTFEIKPGDLIISCSGTIGKVAIVPDKAEPGIINQALLKITLDTSKVDRRFFKFLFESDFIKKEVTAISPGSAMKNIGSVKILNKISFPLPTLSEQQRIVSELDALQSEVDMLKRLQIETAAELDALMPSILDRAFKGAL